MTLSRLFAPAEVFAKNIDIQNRTTANHRGRECEPPHNEAIQPIGKKRERLDWFVL